MSLLVPPSESKLVSSRWPKLMCQDQLYRSTNHLCLGQEVRGSTREALLQDIVRRVPRLDSVRIPADSVDEKSSLGLRPRLTRTGCSDFPTGIVASPKFSGLYSYITPSIYIVVPVFKPYPHASSNTRAAHANALCIRVHCSYTIKLLKNQRKWLFGDWSLKATISEWPRSATLATLPGEPDHRDRRQLSYIL